MLRAFLLLAAATSGQAHNLDALSGVEGLMELVRMKTEEPEALMELMKPLSTIVPSFPENSGLAVSDTVSDLPFVFGHGMGDSCFNPGMKSITEAVGKHAGAYSTCIPTGDNVNDDSNNGFFMDMDKNVDVFAEKIRADPKLAGGFYGVGFSQGNSLIRGYIQKYNDPPVKLHLSVHGTVMGVAGFPSCNPSHNGTFPPLASVCRILVSCLDLAYTDTIQKHLFQADYYRDPRKVGSAAFKAHSQIAQWNNEGDTVNATFKSNFLKTKTYVMVKALKDSMVYPNEAEHWGFFADGGFSTLLTMKETSYYQQDLFGLKTIDEAGGIFFEQTEGNHLQFTETQLYGWVDKYILKKQDSAIMV